MNEEPQVNKGGRPLKFKTVEELQEKIDAYLESCEKNNKPLTITGLAVALDTSRETLLDYEDAKHESIPEEEKERFSDTIKKAKQLCERYVEEYLFTGKNIVGAIFNLKNNYRRWREEQTVEHVGLPFQINISKLDERKDS